MNSFAGLNTGVKALSASQTAIYTINHNISNAGTKGYSRQVVTQKASQALSTGNGSGMIGTGVEITSVIRIRNEFLDNRYCEENVNYGEWSVKSTSLSELESLTNGSADDGLDDVLNSFQSALEDLSDDPSGDSTRAAVLQEGESLCKYLNNLAENCQDVLDDCNNNVKTKVDEINSYAKQICDLNKQIYKSELDGSTANDLRDQRTLLVDKLSQIADVQVSEVKAGTLPSGADDMHFSIKIDGLNLVNHFEVNELECYTIDNGSSNDGTYGVKWAGTTNDVEFDGGEIKGYLDMCHGTGLNGDYKGVQYYMNKLDTFAQTFAKAFNEGIYADGESHCSGHADGVSADDTTGTRFFSYDGKSSATLIGSSTDMDAIYEKITAANISISSDIVNDTDKIATASSSGEAENSDNLTELINIFSDTEVFENGCPSDNVSSIFTTLGVEVSYSTQMSESHKNILDNIETQRQSVSGVSVSEESTNLVVYQQAYNAACKVISVLDEILEVTINSLGADW